MASKRSAIEKNKDDLSSLKWVLSLDRSDRPWQGLPPPAITNTRLSTRLNSLMIFLNHLLDVGILWTSWPGSSDTPSTVLITLDHHMVFPFESQSLQGTEQTSYPWKQINDQDAWPNFFLILLSGNQSFEPPFTKASGHHEATTTFWRIRGYNIGIQLSPPVREPQRHETQGRANLADGFLIEPWVVALTWNQAPHMIINGEQRSPKLQRVHLLAHEHLQGFPRHSAFLKQPNTQAHVVQQALHVTPTRPRLPSRKAPSLSAAAASSMAFLELYGIPQNWYAFRNLICSLWGLPCKREVTSASTFLKRVESSK